MTTVVAAAAQQLVVPSLPLEEVMALSWSAGLALSWSAGLATFGGTLTGSSLPTDVMCTWQYPKLSL